MIINRSLSNCLSTFKHVLKLPTRVTGVKSLQLAEVRALHSSFPLSKEESTDEAVMRGHRPDKWDKHFLVWSKKYKNVDEIPDHVPIGMMTSARNKCRIYVNIGLLVFTLVGCLLMIYTGKRQASTGFHFYDNVKKEEEEEE